MEYIKLEKENKDKMIVVCNKNDKHDYMMLDYEDFDAGDLNKFKYLFNIDFSNSYGYEEIVKVIYYDKEQVELLVYRRYYEKT